MNRYTPQYSRLDCNKKNIVESKLHSIYGREKYVSWTWYLDEATVIFYRYASPQIRTGIDIMIKDDTRIDDGIIVTPNAKFMHVKRLCDTGKCKTDTDNVPIKQRIMRESFVQEEGNLDTLEIWKL